jgi:LL-diaminopimelate aminotransferase
MAFINDHYLKLQAGYLFPEIARRMEAFVARHPGRAGRIIRCGIGDVTEPLPEACIEAMHRAVDDMAHRETFKGYGPATGYPWLREAIAENDFRARRIDVADDEIFLSDGSKVDCGAILDILAPPGRHGSPDPCQKDVTQRAGALCHRNTIAITDPVYPVYVDTNVMAGHTGAADRNGQYAGLVYLPATPENNFVPDIPRDDVHLDIIYLCYPNNPTGGTITHAQLKQWVEYALAHEAIILYDAAYEAYITDSSLPRSIFEIEGARRCAIEFHSFSKSGGFTGLRCGYTVVPKDLMGSTSSGEKVDLHRLWVRRWSTKSNGVSYPVQRAAEALYSKEGKQQVRGLIDHYIGNAKILRAACEEIGLDVYGGVNAPYVWVKCPDGLSSWQMFDRMLEEANVVITPGSGFGRMGEGFFRISAFNSRENVEEVVARLKAMSLQNA